MDTLTNRQSSSNNKSHEEERPEYLDEEEQEKLLQELRTQNEKSNLIIQIGLLFIGILLSAIYIVYEYDTYTSRNKVFINRATIPFPFLSTPVVSQIMLPNIAVILSLGSILSSMALLLYTCHVSFSDIFYFAPSHRGIGSIHHISLSTSIILGSVAPLISLFSMDVTWIEFFYWSLPLGMLLMDIGAIRMMKQVEYEFTDLELRKYKFKGA
ncbi:unnamed protein product [Cunninghamella blakesleeana]